MAEQTVSTEWLAAHMAAPDLVIVDASWHLPTSGRDPKAEYLAGHIPGALFFDIDEIADTTSPLPHMLASPEKFASRMRRMGIGDGKRIVVYDANGIYSAARAWWTFRVFGHEDVTVLNGGLAKWKAEGRPLEEGLPDGIQERHFTARRQTSMVSDKHDVLAAVTSGEVQIADARSPARFAAEEPEPRPGVRGGHMPGARCVHYARLIDANGCLRSPDEIRKIFEDAGIDLCRPVITTCGSGVTAAILTLGLEAVGHNDHGLYDGSWSEWGGDPSLPLETGRNT